MKSAQVAEEKSTYIHFSFLAQAYVPAGDGKRAIDYQLDQSNNLRIPKSE